MTSTLAFPTPTGGTQAQPVVPRASPGTPATPAAPGAPGTLGTRGTVRLLAGTRADRRALSLDEHLSRFGLPPWRGRPQRRLRRGNPTSEGLIGTVERAGLLGRGGAGFPTARKLAAVAGQRRTAIVVANGTEGEPLSRKDQYLLGASPHLVLDGVALAAEAVGADRAVVTAHSAAVDAVRAAVAERAAMRLDPFVIEVQEAPGRFVAGEQTAVVNWVERGKAIPLGRLPRPYERGVEHRPTLINNVETLAHLALVARYGAEWFRSAGTESDPGTSLVTLSGPVAFPGVYEVERGSTLEELLERAGGLTEPAQALLVGGYHGVWVPAAGLAGLRLGSEGIAPFGGSLGAGVLAVLGEGYCGLDATARIARYLAEQSAGQCGPCAFGLPAIAGALEHLASHAVGEPAELRRWLGEVEGRGACRHPDGTSKMIKSALAVFADEIERHAAGSCRALPGHQPVPGHGRVAIPHRVAGQQGAVRPPARPPARPLVPPPATCARPLDGSPGSSDGRSIRRYLNPAFRCLRRGG